MIKKFFNKIKVFFYGKEIPKEHRYNPCKIDISIYPIPRTPESIEFWNKLVKELEEEELLKEANRKKVLDLI